MNLQDLNCVIHKTPVKSESPVNINGILSIISFITNSEHYKQQFLMFESSFFGKTPSSVVGIVNIIITPLT